MQEYMYAEHDQILKLCKLLKEIGPSEKRAPSLKPLIKYQTPEEEQNWIIGPRVIRIISTVPTQIFALDLKSYLMYIYH